MTSLRLRNFMKYPEIGCQIALMPKFHWFGDGNLLLEESKFHRIMSKIGYLNVFYQCFGMIIYLFAVAEHHSNGSFNLVQFCETCSVMGLVMVSICSMLMILFQRDNIEALITELQQLYTDCAWSQYYRIRYYYEKSERLMKYTAVFFMSAYTYYNALPIVELIYELLSDSVELQYKYQSNTWYPWQAFLPYNSILGLIASYICQLLASLVAVAFLMTGEFMLCFFVFQMELHFDGLARAFAGLDASKPESNGQLRAIIATHSQLLRIAAEINSIFSITFLVNFATSTISMCLMCISMLMISPAAGCKYSVGLLSFLVFTFIICYLGSALTTASEKLQPAAFHSNWYMGDRAYRKMILIFIMRSRQPLVLNAYKFTTVSMPTYMAILKFSYQLFAFLHAKF